MFAIELPPGRALKPVDGPLLPVPSRVLRIGLVEDNAEVRQALTMALKKAGHDVLPASSGAELIARLGEQGPDIVITDYRLSTSECGFDVIEAARSAFGKAIPALLVTGDTDPTLVHGLADRGIVVRYKPIKFETLNTSIREATERRLVRRL